jgi:hypothetical protein
VDDLTITDRTRNSLTVTWTQVDDGTGEPALYRVKYSKPPLAWGDASNVFFPDCHRIEGDGIGAEATCTIERLEPATTYDVQLKAFRSVDGKWAGSAASNVVTGETAPIDAIGPIEDLRAT